MKNKYKNFILIEGKEYFDKLNGNSYFSSKVYFNGELAFSLPYQYGYWDSFEFEALKKLKELNLISTVEKYKLEEQGYWVKSIKHENCKKVDVKKWGE